LVTVCSLHASCCTLTPASVAARALARSAGYGGIQLRMTAEYDKATGFMHFLSVDYNRRLASKQTALTTVEVKNLVSDELVEAGFFVDRSYHFREDPRTEQAVIDARRKAHTRGRAAAKAKVAGATVSRKGGSSSPSRRSGRA
jgi:hypothetical protein